MKKNILLALFALLIPAAACAQEKTLYNINDEMLFFVETYAACAAPDSGCNEGDARSIKEGAQNTMRDLSRLFKSGDRSRMLLTADQARSLRLRAGAVQEQLTHIEGADEICNEAIYFFNQLLLSLYSLVLYLNPILVMIIIIFYGGLGEIIHEVIGLLISVPWLLLKALVFSPSCLFWWL